MSQLDPFMSSVLQNSSQGNAMSNLMNIPLNGNYNVTNAGGSPPPPSGGGGSSFSAVNMAGRGMNYGSGATTMTGQNPTATVGANGAMNFMQPMGSGLGGGEVPGTIRSIQTNNPQLDQFSNLLHSLMTQMQGSYSNNLNQYKNLQSSVNGNLQGMGKLGGQQIDMNLKNQMGGMNQNMVSRGLGNTTVQNTMGQGLQRNAQMEHQQLNENVAQQQNATQMQMFGMNPAFNSQQYLSLLPQLGNLAASGMVK